MIDHERFRLLAARRIHEELTAEDERDLATHLAGCPVCRAEERAMRLDTMRLGALLEPVPVRAQVRSAVVASARGRVARASWTLLAAAALLLAGIGGAAVLSGSQRQPTPALTSGSPASLLPSRGASPSQPARASSTTDSQTPVPSGPFGSFLTYPAGDQPHWVDAADLDGDGDVDLVVANNTAVVGVTVLLGDGTGEFRPTASYEAETTGHVVLADVDVDGRPDIVAADRAGNVVVWHGGPRATFGTPERYPTGVAGTVDGNELAVARFNADQWPDVAVVSASAANLTILLGSRDGFGSPRRTVVTGGPSFIQAADFDGDANVDLAIGTGGSFEIAILWGEGTGSFTGPLAFNGQFAPSGLGAGDLDSDRDVDLISADSGPDTVTILINEPAGPFFTPHAMRVPHPGQDGARPISIADVDADGIVDFVVGYAVHDELAFYRGLGGGAFAVPVVVPTGDGPTGVTLADVDGDGDPDAVTANANNGTVSVHLNR